jgi:hypothetical protein
MTGIRVSLFCVSTLKWNHVMPRGRRAKPAEVKQLLGNPGKRRLALRSTATGKGTALPAPVVVEPPSYLTQDREKQAFGWALEHLPPNIVRQTDIHALARWATWLNVWCVCKLALDGKQHWYTTTSSHSPEIHREHPLAKRMDKAEAHLVTLEDRLCLNIVARNNVMHRLFNMPAAHPGGMFAGLDEPDDADKDKPDDGVPTQDRGADLDPLAFIARAGKQHSLN